MEIGRPGLAARRVDRELRRRPQPADAFAVLIPGGQALAPQLGLGCGMLVGGQVLAPRVVLVDPRPELLGGELRKGEQQVAHVALGIDHQRGDAVDGRLFEQADAEAGLAAAGHADADRVGHQVLRVVEHLPVARLARLQVVRPAQIEGAQLLVALHCPLSSG